MSPHVIYRACHPVFLCLLISAATPAVTTASDIILEFSGEVTMSLKTAESLISQVVTKISAGRLLSRSEPKLLPASKEADMRKCTPLAEAWGVEASKVFSCLARRQGKIQCSWRRLGRAIPTDQS